MTETHARTLVRSMTYRLFAWATTILITWLHTGDLAGATGFSTVLHLILSLDYYLHERIWLRIAWGKQP